jgi:hypothetical protein
MFRSTSTSLILLGVLARVSQITMGIELRRSGQTLDKVLDRVA